MGSNIPFMFHSSSPCEVYPGYGHSFHCAAGSGTNKNGKNMTNPSRIEQHDDWMDLLWIELWIDVTSAVSLSIITIVISDFMTKLFVFFDMTKEDSAGGSKMADFENHGRHLQLTISIGIGWYLESLAGIIFQWLFQENPFECDLRALSSYTSNG